MRASLVTITYYSTTLPIDWGNGICHMMLRETAAAVCFQLYYCICQYGDILYVHTHRCCMDLFQFLFGRKIITILMQGGANTLQKWTRDTNMVGFSMALNGPLGADYA